MVKHIYNLHRDKNPGRDRLFIPRIDLATVPKSCDFRSQMPAVYDQGNYGSCTANAGAADWDWIFHREGGKYITPSRFYIYRNERDIDGSPAYEDAGSTGRTLMEAMTQFGVCPESMWSYTDEHFAEKPTKDCYAYGADHQALKHERVSQSKIMIEAAISQGIPLCIGIAVYESFESEEAASTGHIPMPESYESLLGGHEVLMVGYNQDGGIIRNSWGASWGDKGYFYLPWDYLLYPELTFDFWALQKVETGE